MDDRRHTLRHFPVLTTSSVDEARAAVTDVYLPHALRAESGLKMRLNAARRRRFTLGFLAYGAHAELGMPPTETTYHINLTTRGKTFAERGDGTRAATAAAPAASPCCPTSSTPSAGPRTPSSSSSRSRAPGWSRTSPTSWAVPSTARSTSRSASAR
jgi:AraC-binding-like domain